MCYGKCAIVKTCVLWFILPEESCPYSGYCGQVKELPKVTCICHPFLEDFIFFKHLKKFIYLGGGEHRGRGRGISRLPPEQGAQGGAQTHKEIKSHTLHADSASQAVYASLSDGDKTYFN